MAGLNTLLLTISACFVFSIHNVQPAAAACNKTLLDGCYGPAHMENSFSSAQAFTNFCSEVANYSMCLTSFNCVNGDPVYDPHRATLASEQTLCNAFSSSNQQSAFVTDLACVMSNTAYKTQCNLTVDASAADPLAAFCMTINMTMRCWYNVTRRDCSEPAARVFVTASLKQHEVFYGPGTPAGCNMDYSYLMPPPPPTTTAPGGTGAAATVASSPVHHMLPFAFTVFAMSRVLLN